MKTTATHNEKKENLYYFIQATSNETGEVQYMQVADRESAFNALEFICVRAEEKRCHYEIMKNNGGGAVTVRSLDLSRSVTYCVVELAEYQRAAAARIFANLRDSNEMSFKVQLGFGMASGRRACSYTVAWDGNKTAPSNEETRALLLFIAGAPEAAEDGSTTDTTRCAHNGSEVAQVAQFARRVGRVILRGLRHLAAVAALLIVCGLSLSVLFLALNGAAAGLDLVGLEGWPRGVVVLLLAFSVGLDLALWVELNALAVVGRSHVCDIWPSTTVDLVKFHPLPFSVWFRIWKECRQ